MVDDLPQPNPAVESGSTDAAKPEVPEARSGLVQKYLGLVQDGEAFHQKTFDQMRDNQEFAALGADKAWVKSKKYRVPIIARHINQEVDTLYARNPSVVAKRRRKLMYKLWDGRADSLEVAMQGVQTGDMNAIALLSEVVAVRRLEKMFERMAKTMEILWSYFLSEQSANYKQQIKALVRRVKVCKVGFIKLGYQRILEKRPEVAAQIDDVTQKLASVECLLGKAQVGEIDPHQAEAEELRLLLQDLKSTPEMIVREGPVLDFPRANAVIVDPDCFHLKSLAGANWIAFVYEMTGDDVYETYKVKIGDPKEEAAYASSGQKNRKGGSKRKKHRVFEFWNKRTQQVSTFTAGWPDFLKEPAAPEVQLERFWPLFPVVFNEVEHDEMLYPPSDVEQARDIQMEYNRSREALRQHRIAARPFYVEGGRLSEEDKGRLAYHDDHEVITIGSLAANEKIDQLVQRGPTAPIDPNLYEVEMHFQDLLRVVGTQEANLGGVSGGTATESSIAESSRDKSDSSSVDDLDEVLTDLSRAAAQLLLMNMTKEAVIEIVGDGAVWPDTPESRTAAAKELTLEIEAGSSGRPNKAADLADLERVTPLLLQIPGIQSTPIGRKLADLINLDPDELVVDGNPSITAINAILSKAAGAGAPQPGTGDPATDPNQQGGQGAQNAPQPVQNAPGGQPAFPAPGEATGGPLTPM